MKFASFIMSREQNDELQQQWNVYKVFPPIQSPELGSTDYLVVIRSPATNCTHVFPINKDMDKVDESKPLGGKIWGLDVPIDQVVDEMAYKILKPADVNFKSQEQISQEIAAQGNEPPVDLLPQDQQDAMAQQQADAEAAAAQGGTDENGNPVAPQTDEQGNPVVADEQTASVQKAPKAEKKPKAKKAEESEIRDYIYNSFLELLPPPSQPVSTQTPGNKSTGLQKLGRYGSAMVGGNIGAGIGSKIGGIAGGKGKVIGGLAGSVGGMFGGYKIAKKISPNAPNPI